MWTLFPYRRDLYAGAVMALVGAGSIIQGMNLSVGTLTHMGPGFFPIALGALLVILGVAVAITGAASTGEGETPPLQLDLRGGACILLGVVAFIVLGSAFGFAAATFSAVFISALGDRQATLRGSVILAACITVAGAIVFTKLLSIPFPLFTWI